jgi:hypothetical protein
MPEIGAKNSFGKSQNSFGIAYPVAPAYIVARNVALEGSVMDLHIGAICINSSALEVVCPIPRPDIERKFTKFLQTITHTLTSSAVLLWKVLS